MSIITTYCLDYCPFSAIQRCYSTDHTTTDHKVDTDGAMCYSHKKMIAYML